MKQSDIIIAANRDLSANDLPFKKKGQESLGRILYSEKGRKVSLTGVAFEYRTIFFLFGTKPISKKKIWAAFTRRFRIFSSDVQAPFHSFCALLIIVQKQKLTTLQNVIYNGN